jgi:hypothetical protein
MDHTNYLDQPAIQIRLLRDTGKLPANIAIALPRETALTLLSQKNVAVPVGDFAILPDLTLDEDDLRTLEFDAHRLLTATA